MRKIPKKVTLPGGYVVTVRLLSKLNADEKMGDDCFAMWDVMEHQIILRRTRRGQDRVDDFVHEMEHVLVDWKDWYLGKSEV